MSAQMPARPGRTRLQTPSTWTRQASGRVNPNGTIDASLRMDSAFYREIVKLARRDRVSVSHVLRELLEWGFAARYGHD